MQDIQLINVLADQNSKENERKRKLVAARINKDVERRRQAAALADEQARARAQEQLRKEIKQRFMLNPWATEADFNEAWKRDKLALIREYQQSLAFLRR